jgi:hypothetical protein
MMGMRSEMKLLDSWKLYVGLIIAGFIIWVLAGILLPIKPEFHLKYMPETFRSVPEVPIKSIYPEIKFWAETTGKILVGAGGVAGSIKALLNLFRRKK